MHRSILGLGLLAAATQIVATACPTPNRPPIERFTRADCEACWRRADRESPGEDERFRFDWITPAGADAALASAALTEAAERAARAAKAGRGSMRAPAARAGSTLAVSAGPAWYGYVGVQVDAAGRWPRGSQAWLALVEPLDAGSQGNPSARTLVRAVAGPLPLPGPHLHAMRLPATAAPDRLEPRAWIEAADGQILAVVSPACPLR